MTNTTTVTNIDTAGDDRRHGVLPAPRRGARWRWTTSQMARVASEPRPTAATARPMLGGRVTGAHGGTIVVRGRGGSSTTVVETASTSYTTLGRVHAATASSAAPVRVGDHVGVRGTANADGTVTATSVTVFSAPPFGPAGTSKSGTARSGPSPSR